MTREYVVFAARYALQPSVAFVLPALFEHAASKVGVTTHTLLSRATYEAPVGQYMADCARRVAKEAKA